MKPTIKIAVRALVEHVLRSGDLRSDFWGSVDAVEGIRVHQRVQRNRPSGYESEVAVQGQVEGDGFNLAIGGRIDGVLRSDAGVCVEEIKTTRIAFKDLADKPNPIHWGQAICYAHLLAGQESLPGVDVRLTYVHTDPWREKSFTRPMTSAELADYFGDVVLRYMTWMGQIVAWLGLRDESLQRMTFPYADYRPGQRGMAVEVYRILRDGGHLIAQAPTGIGKTMAVLFPALKAQVDQLLSKVIFLTARTTGRIAAEEAFAVLRRQGVRVKTVTLTAKDKICFRPESACLPEECPYAEGYFDRLNHALGAAFHQDAFTRDVVEAIAEAHRVCPFEFSLELVNWADVIIGDYNYAFDPRVVLRRLFVDNGAQHAVLVDEAHNLVDRSREMFSAQLSKAPVLAMRRLLKAQLPALSRILNRINVWLAAARRHCKEDGGSRVDREAPQSFIELLRKFIAAAEKWLSLNEPAAFRDELIALFFDIAAFIRIADQYSQCYTTIMESRDQDFTLKLFCLDPADQLRQAWSRCRAAVLFSATLTPADYFQSILGCSPQTRRIALSSPFPEGNLLVCVASNISTYYRQRVNSSAMLTRTLADLVARHRGHYLFFFPSYEYLEMIRRQFVLENSDVEIISQSREMTEDQKEEFLNRFKIAVSGTLVGFAVMGGIFGEGIDLKGDHLTGAAIVGVGLPGISIERDLIRDYFQATNNQGFEFAYQYPGMVRVLQAAGRVIRSEADRGVVLLIDQRYATPKYARLLPIHWHLQQLRGDASLSETLVDFWRQ